MSIDTNDDDRVTYPAKNDYAFIELAEAARAAREARAKSGDYTGKTSAPKSKTIYGGQNGSIS